jgi:hypothetical protein
VIPSGDEEKASRQEGCPEEEEITQGQVTTLGAAPPSGTYTLFYLISVRQEQDLEILFIKSRN